MMHEKNSDEKVVIKLIVMIGERVVATFFPMRFFKKNGVAKF